MAYADGTPSWVELQTPDLDGARAFYGQLFGWTAEVADEPEAMGYTNFLKNGKRVAGAGPTQGDGFPPAWTTYFATSDAAGVASRVGQAGGKVLMPPMDVMGYGRMGVFSDNSGATWAVWQAGTHGGAELTNQPGSLTWNELMTNDVPGSKAFYHAALGLGAMDVPDSDVGYVLFTVAGRPIAGMMPYPEDMPPDMPPEWSVYFAIEDTDATVKLATSLGASIIMPATDSPAGRFAILADPQGANFSVIKNDPNFMM